MRLLRSTAPALIIHGTEHIVLRTRMGCEFTSATLGGGTQLHLRLACQYDAIVEHTRALEHALM